MPSLPPQFVSGYAYCFCIRCNGSLRTKRTVIAHNTNVQRRPGKNDRICHCSRHPLGARVHRHTFRKHVTRDKRDEVTVNLSEETVGDLMDLDTDEEIPAQTHLDAIQQILNAHNLAESLFLDGAEELHDEVEFDSEGLSTIDDGEDEDNDESGLEEMLDDLEAGASGEPLSTGL
jgi:hypothetical protein